MTDTIKKREKLLRGLFPEGIPRIWCPPLTHYKENGSINFERIKKHISHIVTNVNSFMIPGSTGDGWELSLDEYRELIDFFFSRFEYNHEINIVIGLLRESTDDVLRCMDSVVEFFQQKDIGISAEHYEMSWFKGFVICPPRGRDLSQEEIKTSMEKILARGYPTVLYQLPQITENEMHPDLVRYFADTYYNCYMLKDSSGRDAVADAGKDYKGMVLLRGAEGNYSKMLKKTGGSYDGFLLSTGNTFAEELAKIIRHIQNDNLEGADKISTQVTEAIFKTFRLASNLPSGNVFTNSNKLIDHIMAYSSHWKEYRAPRLHSGDLLNQKMLEEVEEILMLHNLFPERGYME
jgi:dihydrodipicolinate synthase/N-acetylneuraminate lyase